MARVAINILGWNHPPELLYTCIDAVLAQTFSDFEIVYTDNASENGTCQRVLEKYRDCDKLRVVANAVNKGYSGGHNEFIAGAKAEFVMVLNPDAVLEQDFLVNVLQAFADPRVASATGKMLRLEQSKTSKPVLDGTGIIMTKTRVARERGQLEIDNGQYDKLPDVFGVSGTAAIYRRAALLEAEILPGEYFDKDFFAYSEDWDLAWRLRLLGYSARFVPQALVYHERVVSRVKWSLAHPLRYVFERRQLSMRRGLGWRNRIWAIIKNDFGSAFWRALPLLVGREIAAFFYLLIFETKSLSLLPSLFGLFPSMIRKRKIIQRKRRIPSKAIEPWF